MAQLTPPSPAASLLDALRPQLARHPPFAQMPAGDVDFFLAHAQQRYYAPGETVTEPGAGPAAEIFFLRQGAVTGTKGMAELFGDTFRYEEGDLFPLAAALARREVTSTYRATADTFVLALPVAAMEELAGRSPPFADFLQRRIGGLLELSRSALHVTYASRALAEQTLETPLGQLANRAPVTCPPGTSLRTALGEMHARRIGSIVVAGPSGEALGILTRHDVLDRVALAQPSLDTPIAQVMAQPVHTLDVANTAQDAALLMSRHGIRHVPVTRGGAVVGIVSERDLFALQRLSLQQLGATIRAAGDVAALRAAAQDIRRFARNLLGQGVQARQLTALVSHLNDVLTQRVLELLAPEHNVVLSRMCWLALGSEGRGEQTIATDQDNALLLPDDSSDAQKDAARAFGRAVNLALAECGYPLCRGGVMAGEPDGTATLAQWRARFAHWVGHGAPQDLLQASIYFDLRALAGDASLAQALRGEVLEQARRTPRFLKQLALNALSRPAPLDWLGGIATAGDGTVDLKLQGAALFVDAARLYSLAHGVDETGTSSRLAAVGARMGLASSEYEAWVGAFEFLQMLRLRIQLDERDAGAHPNRLRPADLNDIDRRILKEAFRLARALQQRMHLDYDR